MVNTQTFEAFLTQIGPTAMIFKFLRNRKKSIVIFRFFFSQIIGTVNYIYLSQC